jgi:valyl-tRNA synthetase
MDKLAELAMEAVRDGRLRFFPERYAKTYLDWLSEKRDWCISRQLWWGHRIPVWRGAINLFYVDCAEAELPERRRDFVRVLQNCLDRLGSETGCSGEYCAIEDVSNWAGCLICAKTERSRELLRKFEPLLTDQFPALTRADYERHELEPFGTFESASRWKTELNELVTKLEEDPDVLDTWFSSSLWPLSTLGWPHEQQGSGIRDQGTGSNAATPPVPCSLFPVPSDFDYFYPTDVLCTGRGIITLWVARMVIMGLAFDKHGELNFRGRVPFSHAYINPTIQDGQGRTMSKSLGNGVDPLDIIELYGTDALRWTMTALSGETQDIRIPVAYCCPHCGGLTPQSAVVPKGKFPIDVKQVTCSACKKPFATQWADDATQRKLGVAKESSERFEAGRNFVNKIWQAATGFVLPSCSDVRIERREHTYHTDRIPEEGDLFDKWIRARLSHCIEKATDALERYEFQRLCDELRSFFWNEFCDWYLEEAKVRLQSSASNDVKICMLQVLDISLCLLHPVIPFVTERIWQQVGEMIPRHHELIWPEAEHASALLLSRPGTDVPTKAPALMEMPWPDRWPEIKAEWTHEVGDVMQPVVRALRDSLASLNNSRSAARQSALGKLPRAVIRAGAADAALLNSQLPTLLRLGRCEALEIGEGVAKPAESTSRVLPGGIEVYVPVAGLMDLEAEKKRLRKETAELTAHIGRVEGKLANEGFVAKAPAEVIAGQRQRLAEMRDKLGTLARNLAELDG